MPEPRPEAETREAEAPEVEAPEVETPEVETPEVETPEVETPEPEAYGLDDLIAHEKGQTKLVLVLFLLALAWAVVQRLRGEDAAVPFAPDPDAPPPVSAPAEPGAR